jgi:hypothetical protein
MRQRIMCPGQARENPKEWMGKGPAKPKTIAEYSFKNMGLSRFEPEAAIGSGDD